MWIFLMALIIGVAAQKRGLKGVIYLTSYLLLTAICQIYIETGGGDLDQTSIFLFVAFGVLIYYRSVPKRETDVNT